MWLIYFCLFYLISSSANAYMEDYPPHQFKQGAYKHIQIKPLVDYDHQEYVSKDGNVKVRMIENPDSLGFLIKEGKKTIVSRKERDGVFPYAVYQYDLDNNGQNDYIVFNSYRGTGLAIYAGRIDIYLKQSEGKFRSISYDSWSADITDFVDINNDGRIGIIVGGSKFFGDHNYFTYNIYEIQNFKMVNINKKFKGFPKFVWYTHKPNDKDTVKISAEDRSRYVAEVDKIFKYESIK